MAHSSLPEDTIVAWLHTTLAQTPKPRLVITKGLFYALGHQGPQPGWQVVKVSARVVFGGPHRFVKQLCMRQLGTTIQTVFMERWYSTLRGLVAPLQRRTRCLSWSRARH